MVRTVNWRCQCVWRIIGSGFLDRWSRKIGDGDLSQMLEMEILEAEQLLVMTRSRTLLWERVEGRSLQQGQVKVVI